MDGAGDPHADGDDGRSNDQSCSGWALGVYPGLGRPCMRSVCAFLTVGWVAWAFHAHWEKTRVLAEQYRLSDQIVLTIPGATAEKA
ncbi:MAG: hypothetical protein SVT56_13300 [Chloroflexota bacterium]|nr:hypothetical protein [Chloroflexota bacterium]